jgi:hypothetical protein
MPKNKGKKKKKKKVKRDLPDNEENETKFKDVSIILTLDRHNNS